MKTLDTDEAVDEFVKGFTSVNVLYMCNEDPDIRVLRLLDEAHLEMLVGDCFGDGDGVMQIIVENGSKKKGLCTHFRVFLQGCGTKKPTNYKLEGFMRMINVKGVSVRCEKAVVVGLDGPLGTLVDVPPELAIGFVPEVGAIIATEVFDCLGKCLPLDLVWCVVKYMSHPLADLMRDHIEESNAHCAFYLAWTFECDHSRL